MTAVTVANPSPPVRPVVRVSVAQVASTEDHEANRRAAVEAIAAAAASHADLVVLPEYSSAFTPAGVGLELAEPVDGPFVTTLREHAASTGVAVVAGTALPGAGRASNVIVAVDAHGDLVGQYHKVHLYDAFGSRESDHLEPGPADAPPLVFDVHGLRFGVMTCYDLRFPESARRLVDAGAQVLLVPAAWASGPLKVEHFTTLATARAIENTAIVVGVGLAGPGVIGHSLAVGPDGVVGAALDGDPGFATVDLDPEQVTAVRGRNPSLANRRYRVVPA
ncbi:MAG: carbon-nitrogen hydrolase family protein [Micrococcales bacterium]|nr:carbon-nitrogen hydrolase family protein [Micrococcales bacterium]MCL2666114.1 carbon-nitrogen hydrolase family protein [Micrococcales bacterium]